MIGVYMKRDTFKTVPGFDQRYTVDSSGRMRCSVGQKPFLLRRIMLSDGYQHVDIRTENGARRRMHVHRLVMLAHAYHPDHERLVVRHLNYVKTDNRLKNLVWAATAGNPQDAANG